MGLRRILILILLCLKFSTCDAEVSELSFLGFEENINLDFAVLELVHWQCYCCSMSRSEPGVFM